jgi:diaminopimelate epimerase
MTNIQFYKYQGTGNDFVITSDTFTLSTEQIVKLCDRKFGIGADGVIVMKKESSADFDMMYYNADGSESFCGNGSRCAVMHAKFLGWIENKCSFNSNDGLHEAKTEGELVHLKMHNVNFVDKKGNDYIINTGSPHYILLEDSLDFDIVATAKEIRYSAPFTEKGINVNFIKPATEALEIRTYERGVEDETLSCGSGVTAAVIAEFVHTTIIKKSHYRKVQTKGGELAVSFENTIRGFENIYLIGPAVQVFAGKITL